MTLFVHARVRKPPMTFSAIKKVGAFWTCQCPKKPPIYTDVHTTQRFLFPPHNTIYQFGVCAQSTFIWYFATFGRNFETFVMYMHAGTAPYTHAHLSNTLEVNIWCPYFLFEESLGEWMGINIIVSDICLHIVSYFYNCITCSTFECGLVLLISKFNMSFWRRGQVCGLNRQLPRNMDVNPRVATCGLHVVWY